MQYRQFSKSTSDYLAVKLGITADVILDTASKNNKGILGCRIERWQANKVGAECESSCRARALLVEHNGRLLFYFIRHTLKSCVLEKQFADNIFKIGEMTNVPNDIAVELGFPLGTYIKKGYYQVIDLGAHLSIALNVGRS